MATTDIRIAIQSTWYDIKQWYVKNAPSQLEDFKDGVSESEWLESYKNELYQGVYEVDEDGYLIF